MPQTLWRLLAWAASLGLVAACLLPSSSVPGPELPGADKAFHLLSFAAVTFLWRLSGASVRRVALIGALLAVGTELGQSLLPLGRQGSWLDLLADALGILAGLAIPLKRKPRDDA